MSFLKNTCRILTFAVSVTLIVFTVMVVVINTAKAETQPFTMPGFPATNFNPPGMDTCVASGTGACNTEDELGKWTVVRQNGGKDCKSGYFYVLNTETLVYNVLQTELCEDNVHVKLFNNPYRKTKIAAMMLVNGKESSVFEIE